MVLKKKAAQPAGKSSSDPKSAALPPRDNTRETVESIVIAFVLAFLFRTFEAEAFVIPTGSMAPTLMGRHKDLKCERCGFPYRVSASEEVDDEGLLRPGEQVMGCICPQCRYRTKFPGKQLGPEPPPSYRGDRILVAKFPFDWGNPARWDVAVFKYPETAKQNFIKRIVGLPNETVRIQHGNIFARPDGAQDFAIQRKPHAKVQAMLQVVYDNDFALPMMIERGWPARWQSSEKQEQGSWATIDEYRSFKIDGTAKHPVWLRYKHTPPAPDDWDLLDKGNLTAEQVARIKPMLITDCYAYNGGLDARVYRMDGDEAPHWSAQNPDWAGLHWIGDLALECEVESLDGQGALTLELVEAGRKHQCRFELTTGQATLSISTQPEYKPTAETKVLGAGTHTVRLANVDDRLLLWVDGKPVEFDVDTAYDVQDRLPKQADLTPASVGAEGAALRISHVRLLRDVYYIADNNRGGGHWPSHHRTITGYVSRPRSLEPSSFYSSDGDDVASTIAEYLSNPRYWGDMRDMRSVEFALAEEQYMVLGDNSPKSKDSRLWKNDEHFVDRDLLIGKAVFVYWPHAWAPSWSIPISFRGYEMDLPFYPNFKRMKVIR